MNISAGMKYSPLRPAAWFEKYQKSLVKQNLATEIVQRVGDTLFVPNGWGYFTKSCGDTVEISQRFCLKDNVNSIFDQLSIGSRLYGK